MKIKGKWLKLIHNIIGIDYYLITSIEKDATNRYYIGMLTTEGRAETRISSYKDFKENYNRLMPKNDTSDLSRNLIMELFNK